TIDAARVRAMEDAMIHALTGRGWILAWILCLELVAQLILIGELYWTIRSMGVAISPLGAVFVEGLSKGANVVQLVGVTEASYAVLFKWLGLTAAVGFTLSLVKTVRSLVAAAIGLTLLSGAPPVRFVAFAIASGGWLATMMAFPEARLLAAAGSAWFANWGVQIAVSIAWWLRPSTFTIPHVLMHVEAHLDHLPGVSAFGRVAKLIHPFQCAPGSLPRLQNAMTSAGSTHLITATIVAIGTVVCGSTGFVTIAAFL